MNMTIDFARLTLRDALDIGIVIEDGARERYEELAAQLEEHHTHDAAEFFREMAGVEADRAEQLRGRRRERYGDEPSAIDAALLDDVVAPFYGEVRAYMTVHKALRVARKAELRGLQFMNDAIAVVEDERARALFTELRDDGIAHDVMVARRLAELPPEDTSGAMWPEDEPVAQ